MGPEIIGVFIPLAAVVGFFSLMSLKVWSSHKLQMRNSPNDDSEQLAETVQHLYDELATAREDIADLQERMDFNERMLADVRSKKGIGSGDSD